MMDVNRNHSDLPYGRLNVEETTSVSKPGTLSKGVKLWLVILSILVIFSVIAVGIFTGIFITQKKYMNRQEHVVTGRSDSQLQKNEIENKFEAVLADVQEMRNETEEQKSDLERKYNTLKRNYVILQESMAAAKNRSDLDQTLMERKYATKLQEFTEKLENKSEETSRKYATKLQAVAEKLENKSEQTSNKYLGTLKEINKMKNESKEKEKLRESRYTLTVNNLQRIDNITVQLENRMRMEHQQWQEDLQRRKNESIEERRTTESKYLSVEQRIAKLKKESETRGNMTEKKYEAVERDIEDMRTESQDQSVIIQALQNDLLGIKQEAVQLQNNTEVEHAAMETALQSMNNGINTFQQVMTDKVNKLKTTIAFSTYMDKAGAFYPSDNQIIPFNKVITNLGNNFDKTTSKFRCPVKGVYAFWFNLYTGALQSSSKKKTSAELVINGTRLSEAYCRNDDSNQVQMMCGNFAVTECSAQSQVWVRSVYGDSKVYGRYDKETTFAGFLIQSL